jgi:flagellar motility protein MotE (MotC chaperone)
VHFWLTRQKYAKLFNEGLENAPTNTRFAKASAWYIATYQEAIREEARNKEEVNQEEIGKEEVNRERIDKEEEDKEEENKEEENKEEENKEEENKEEENKEEENKEEENKVKIKAEERERDSCLCSFCWVVWTDCIALKKAKAHKR